MPPVHLVSPADDTLPASIEFNRAYTSLLKDLEQAWNGGDSTTLVNAAFVGMPALSQAADAPFQSGAGPAFVRIDDSGGPVAYFRDLGDWSNFHATPEVRTAIERTFGFFDSWITFAWDASKEQAWIDSLSGDPAQQAVTMLSANQKQTVETHYGVPVPLLTLLDGFERFGNGGLPDDPDRPQVPRHNMNAAIMWFVLSAFAEACVRLEISAEFWVFYMRAILCGLLNDGLFRGRFPVQGFQPTPEGRLAVFQYVQAVADADLPAELRQRYVESGFAS